MPHQAGTHTPSPPEREVGHVGEARNLVSGRLVCPSEAVEVRALFVTRTRPSAKAAWKISRSDRARRTGPATTARQSMPRAARSVAIAGENISSRSNASGTLPGTVPRELAGASPAATNGLGPPGRPPQSGDAGRSSATVVVAAGDLVGRQVPWSSACPPGARGGSSPVADPSGRYRSHLPVAAPGSRAHPASVRARTRSCSLQHAESANCSSPAHSPSSPCCRSHATCARAASACALSRKSSTSSG